MAIDQEGSRSKGHQVLYRSLIHAGLIITAIGALVTLEVLHIRIAIHTDVGLAFMALVVIHLAQRRKTVGRLVSELTRLRSVLQKKIRLAGSDALLAFFALNVLVSGIVDWNQGHPTQLPILPVPFCRWHALSSVVLVVYLIVHVWRRRKRLWRSRIR